MRFITTLTLVAVVVSLMACGSSSDDPEGEREVSAELAAACESLCTAQEPCNTIGWTQQECADACAADVGTPGADCTAAIAAWAECMQDDCAETACSEQQSARDNACGGTG